MSFRNLHIPYHLNTDNVVRFSIQLPKLRSMIPPKGDRGFSSFSISDLSLAPPRPIVFPVLQEVNTTWLTELSVEYVKLQI
jgi:hypothetical protein